MERRRVDEIDAQLDRTPQNLLRVLAIRPPTQIPSPVRRSPPRQFSIIRRLERQLHPRDFPRSSRHHT